MRLIGLVVVLTLGFTLPANIPEAQETRTPPRVGWLTSSVVHGENVKAFRDGMRALGYPDVTLEIRAAENQTERLAALAADLAGRHVEVIVTDGGPAAVAARQATSSIPVVIGATAGDLVQAGLVTSLARPGGNVTGFTISTGPELYGKRLELLREALPGLDRVAVLWNPRNDVARGTLGIIEVAAKRLGIQVGKVEAPDIQAIDRAFGSIARSRADAVLTVADAFLWSQRATIVAAAARHRLPGIYPEREYADAGGLMAYGPNVPDNFRRVAGYVDRILKGANPADLPVQQPTKFELVINMKTAKALGITIPQTVILQATQVIEQRVLDQRGRLLVAALGFAGLPRPSYDRSLWALRTWLDSWSGIGRIAVGMARQGYDLQITRYDERGWRATFYTTGMEHSPTSATGTGWERTPWHAVQGAARDALRKVPSL